MSTGPWASYLSAVVRIDLPSGTVEVGPTSETGPGAGSSVGGAGGSRGVFPFDAGETVFIITAVESASTDADANLKQNAELLADIEAFGAAWYPAAGADPTWTHQEASFAVLGLSDDQAIGLGQKHQQDAIFEWTCDSWTLIDCRSRNRTSMSWVSRPVDD